MSTEYVTAEHVPAELRLMAHTGVIHVRSRFTRHWDGIGTPMCNDGRQLPIAPPDTGHGYLCRRCLTLYRKATA
jgi:hypothetical protein